MSVQARLRSEHQRKYPELSPSKWYEVAPIFPGVTQRMVNMAGAAGSQCWTFHPVLYTV